MRLFKKLPNLYDIKKLTILGGILCAASVQSQVYAESSTLAAIPKLELSQYLGLWYEVARKPLYYEKECASDVTARYTVNEYGNVAVDNRCIRKDGSELRSLGEAFISNEPFNSKFKVSFIPEAIRWLPVARGDYWILKIDPHYQMALVGEPKRKYLWLLSRNPHPDEVQVTEFLRYAQSVGFNIKDLIRTKQNVMD